MIFLDSEVVGVGLELLEGEPQIERFGFNSSYESRQDTTEPHRLRVRPSLTREIARSDMNLMNGEMR